MRLVISTFVSLLFFNAVVSARLFSPPRLEIARRDYVVNGRVVEQTDSFGKAHIVRTYGFHYNTIEDKENVVILLAIEQWFDSNGKPTLNSDGVHACFYKRLRRDGSCTCKFFVDTRGDFMENKAGIASVNYRYDRRGYLKEERYYDLHNQRACDENGIHRIAYRPLGQGWALFGLNGEKRCNGDGIHRRVYDGSRSCYVCYDANGDEVAKKNQVTLEKRSGLKIVEKYDRNRKPIEKAWFTRDGRAANNSRGFHRVVTSYNPSGKWTSRSYFKADGKPWADKSGVHAIERNFGNRVGTRHLLMKEAAFGLRGQPVAIDESGYHKITYSYDKKNNRTSKCFWGVSGKAHADAHGVHRYVETYDKRGRQLTLRAKFDVNGLPTPGPDKWVRIEYRRGRSPKYIYPKKAPQDKQYPVDIDSEKDGRSVYVKIFFKDDTGKICYKAVAGDASYIRKDRGKEILIPRTKRIWVKAGAYTVKAARIGKFSGDEREKRCVVTPGPGVRAHLRFDW